MRLTARDQKIASTGLDYRDLFAMHRVGDRVALQVFVMRRGIVVDRKEFFWDSVGEVDDGELLASFLQQYYHGEQYFPPEICVPCICCGCVLRRTTTPIRSTSSSRLYQEGLSRSQIPPRLCSSSLDSIH